MRKSIDRAAQPAENGPFQMILSALDRFRVTDVIQETPYILAKEKKKHWVISSGPDELRDIDILEFAEYCKNLKRIENKRKFRFPRLNHLV